MNGPSAMVSLPAQLTLREAGVALRALVPAIHQAPAAMITLDAAPLEQIDSAALAVLLAVRRWHGSAALKW